MTAASRLRELVQAATPGPWIPLRDCEVVTVCTHDGSEVLPWNEGADQVSEDDANLIALAPNLAAWAADAAEELLSLYNAPGEINYLPNVRPLLARLDGLLPEQTT